MIGHKAGKFKLLRGRFIDSGYCRASYNMQQDLENLEFCIQSEVDCVLRIYGWDPPAISYGRSQKEKLNITTDVKNNYDHVVRPTGGRAVLHQGDLSYSFVVSADKLTQGETIVGSYKEISQALMLGLSYLGVKDL